MQSHQGKLSTALDARQLRLDVLHCNIGAQTGQDRDRLPHDRVPSKVSSRADHIDTLEHRWEVKTWRQNANDQSFGAVDLD